MIIEKFLDPNAPSLPKQVAENTKEIEALSESFRTSESLTSNSTSIDISTTNIDIKDAECSIGRFLYSTNGLMFKIVAIEGNKVFIDFYSQFEINIIKTEFQTIRNMLVNPAFTINQDGQQNYSGDGIYTADQWIMESSETIVTPYPSGGCDFQNNSSTEHFIEQIIPIYDTLNFYNKTYTATAYLRDGVTLSVQIKPQMGQDLIVKNDFENVSLALEWDDSEKYLIFKIYVHENVKIAIKCCTLGQSETSLIYNERSREEELDLCYFFYEKIPITEKFIIFKWAFTGENFYEPNVYLKTNKRTRPTIRLFDSETNQEGYLNTNIGNAQVNVFQTQTNCFKLQSNTSELSAGYGYGGYYIADARIY